MNSIDKEKFGQFLVTLRKDKKITQKELAEKLFISDKAVSKWERGQSLPDISLLIHISNFFDVTIAELLEGKYIENSEAIPLEQSNKLLERIILMKSKSFNPKDLLVQKERLKTTCIKSSIFTICSIISTILLFSFSFGVLLEKIIFANIAITGPTIKLLACLLIGYNLISVVIFFYYTYKKSICYLVFSPVYLISAVVLFQLIDSIKQMSDFEIAYMILREMSILYMIGIAICLVLILYGLHKYCVCRNKENDELSD